MAQLKLQNRDTKVIKTGDYVKFAPNTLNAIVFASIGDPVIIGTSAAQIYPGKWGLVNLLNTVSLIADGIYTMGLGLGSDGTITVVNGIITNIVEAT